MLQIARGHFNLPLCASDGVAARAGARLARGSAAAAIRGKPPDPGALRAAAGAAGTPQGNG